MTVSELAAVVVITIIISSECNGKTCHVIEENANKSGY
jgi:hypothetical protein